MVDIATVVTEYGGGLPVTSITRHRFRRSDLGAFVADDAHNAQGCLHTFWTNVKALMPNDWAAEVQVVCPVVDDLVGSILPDVVSSVVQDGVVGTGGDSFTRGSGLRANWGTSTILFGRHVHGATFLVPCADSAFASDGRPSAGTADAVAAACATLISDAAGVNLDFVIYSRPDPGTEHVPPRAPRDGTASLVVTGEVHGNPAGLRRRRG